MTATDSTTSQASVVARVERAYSLIEQVELFELELDDLGPNDAQRVALNDALAHISHLKDALNRVLFSIPQPQRSSGREAAAYFAAGWALAAFHSGHRVRYLRIEDSGDSAHGLWGRWRYKSYYWDSLLTGAFAVARLTGIPVRDVLAERGPVPHFDLHHSVYALAARDFLDGYAADFALLVRSLLEHGRLAGRHVHHILEGRWS